MSSSTEENKQKSESEDTPWYIILMYIIFGILGILFLLAMTKMISFELFLTIVFFFPKLFLNPFLN